MMLFFSILFFQQKLNLNHVESYDPQIFKSMKQVLEYDGDVSDFGLDFTVTYNSFGETKIYPLK